MDDNTRVHLHSFTQKAVDLMRSSAGTFEWCYACECGWLWEWKAQSPCADVIHVVENDHAGMPVEDYWQRYMISLSAP